MDLDASKKKELLSSAMKRTSEWIFSQEIPSDVTVNVGGTSFSLHKFPLVSKCGYIRKLFSESTEEDDVLLSTIEIPDLPGGPDCFELTAKFCYGINFEINTENIAMLRCAADYLEMTEDYSVGNLVGRTEAYINEVALKSLAGSVSILRSSEDLFPTAERVKLVSRCIDTIAFVACKDSQFSGPKRADNGAKPVVDWWAEDLTVIRIDLFQRVLIAMMARGFEQYALGPILMMYAQKSLRGLDIFGKGRKKNMEARQEHEKRVVLETIVSLLPKEKNTMSVSFLSMLLRASIYLETTVACRLDLEKRMGGQLGQAVMDDLLIPSYSFAGDTVFDIETVQRIMTNFIDDSSETGVGCNVADDQERVTKLMENYLAEIASDRNLSVSRFIGLAEVIPEQSRMSEDGMYRAIDIYLKAHPALSDTERKKVCSLMDCQKLSREACAHAAQNDRLPVQTVVQVLYYEQQRLREAVDGSPSQTPKPVGPYSVDIHPVTTDEVSTLRRENEELKLELVKVKTMLKEIMEKTNKDDHKSTTPAVVSSPRPGSANKPPLPRKSFISSVSKKLGKFMADGVLAQGPKGRTKPSRDRRHSVS